jgi:hypothetical protein
MEKAKNEAESTSLERGKKLGEIEKMLEQEQATTKEAITITLPQPQIPTRPQPHPDIAGGRQRGPIQARSRSSRSGEGGDGGVSKIGPHQRRTALSDLTRTHSFGRHRGSPPCDRTTQAQTRTARACILHTRTHTRA